MIYKLQTKSEEVVLDHIKQTKGRVILSVKEIVFNGLSYRAVVEYSITNGIVLHSDTSTFTVSEADALYENFGITGNTFSEKFVDLIKKASTYQLSQSGVLGLTSDDWEEYEEPVYEPTPEE